MTSPLEHQLGPDLVSLHSCQSTRELLAHPVFVRIRGSVESVLNAVHVENFAEPRHSDAAAAVRVTAWNIERGNKLTGIIEALRSHPVMRSSDLLLLTELDYGMARSGNHFVAREIAQALGMNVAFAPCYIALNKGSGVESAVTGDNTLALHGNALLARWPIRNVHSLALPNGKDKMAGKEKRLGSQRCVIADVDHPAGLFRAVTLHLDAHSSQNHRHRQMQLLLDHLDSLSPRLPVLIGGDWNTTTHDASRALYSILGYWRRVMMGVKHVVRNHYPYPERWFERKLFGELERRGYDYKRFNVPGACTLHYDVSSLATFKNLAEWVPLWCFKFIEWALRDLNGRCSLKLDWFAGRNLTSSGPQVLADVNVPAALSDHDPITVELFVVLPI